MFVLHAPTHLYISVPQTPHQTQTVTASDCISSQRGSPQLSMGWSARTRDAAVYTRAGSHLQKVEEIKGNNNMRLITEKSGVINNGRLIRMKFTLYTSLQRTHNVSQMGIS